MATEQNSSMKLQVGEAPPLAKHDSSVLDLAFVMDVTGSMGSYIHAAQQSIRQIVEEIVASEKSDIRLALVEYRDHPPQDRSFVTRTNDFTDSVKKMKGWLDESKASGGGDGPEAVADGIHDCLKLNWRPEATKICVLIADAPPHGLMGRGDGFPDGCPIGLDPVVIINQMAEKNITVYSVGCEPAINQCRDFFMALAHITGGQYVPLTNAKLLSKVIIGGAQEEITLQRLMEEVHEEVVQEMQARGVDELDEEDLAINVHKKLASRGAKAKALRLNDVKLEAPSGFAQSMASKGGSMADWKKEWDAAGKSKSEPAMSFGGCGGGGAPRMMRSMCAPPPPPGGAPMRRGMKMKKKNKKAVRLEVADGAEDDASEEECEEECDDMLGFDSPDGGAMPGMPPPPMMDMPMSHMAMSDDGPAPPPPMNRMPQRMMSEGRASSATAPAAPVVEDAYSVVDAEVDLDQARRMVKKSIAMNKKNYTK